MRLVAAILAWVAALAATHDAHAQKVDFGGQKITLAVGSTAGGASCASCLRTTRASAASTSPTPLGPH